MRNWRIHVSDLLMWNLIFAEQSLLTFVFSYCSPRHPGSRIDCLLPVRTMVSDRTRISSSCWWRKSLKKDRGNCSELRWWKTFCVIFIVRNRIPDFCCTSRLIFCFRNVFRFPPALLVCQAFIRSCSRASSSTWLCHSLQFRSGLHFVDFDPEQGTDRPLGVFFVPVTTTTPGISGPLLPLAEFTLSLSILGVSCSWYHLHRYLRASLTDWFSSEILRKF